MASGLGGNSSEASAGRARSQKGGSFLPPFIAPNYSNHLKPAARLAKSPRGHEALRATVVRAFDPRRVAPFQSKGPAGVRVSLPLLLVFALWVAALVDPDAFQRVTTVLALLLQLR
jgi:hypothetical protein